MQTSVTAGNLDGGGDLELAVANGIAVPINISDSVSALLPTLAAQAGFSRGAKSLAWEPG